MTGAIQRAHACVRPTHVCAPRACVQDAGTSSASDEARAYPCALTGGRRVRLARALAGANPERAPPASVRVCPVRGCSDGDEHGCRHVIDDSSSRLAARA